MNKGTNLTGLDSAEQTLLRAARSRRLAHAWLITGPDGTGKRTLAYRFARFLLAHGKTGAGSDASSLDVPDNHPVARRIAAGAHGDLIYLSRQVIADGGRIPRELPVAAIRRVRPFLSMTAAEGGWRIAIVDDADTMTRSAANAILKVLEEPPRDCVLILLSSNPGALLPTIRSRCRLLRLAPMQTAHLAAALKAARPNLFEVDAAAYAIMARGAFGAALALCDGDALDRYRDLLGMLRTIGEGGRGRDAAILSWAEALAAKDEDFDQTFALYGDLLERWISALARGDEPAVILPEEAEMLSPSMRRGGVDRLLTVWEKTRHLLDRAARANLDRRLTAVEVLETFARP